MSFDDKRASGVCTRRLAHPECGRAARLHLSGLSEDFIARFGEKFLERYYLASLDSPFADVMAASDPASGDVLGILLGVFDTPAHYSFILKRHGVSLALRVAIRSVADPALGLDLLRSRGTRYARGVVRSLSNAGRRGEQLPDEKAGMIAHLVVDENSRGLDIGRTLVESFEFRAREFGLRKIELVTHPGDRGAGSFYRKLGWTYSEDRISRSGEPFELYVKRMTS